MIFRNRVQIQTLRLHLLLKWPKSMDPKAQKLEVQAPAAPLLKQALRRQDKYCFSQTIFWWKLSILVHCVKGGCGFFIPWEYEKSARNYAKLPIFKCVLLVLPVENLPWNCSKVHELHICRKNIRLVFCYQNCSDLLWEKWF